MMRITLAVPYGDHAPDSTIEVEDGVARQMIDTGRARPAAGATSVTYTPAPVKTLVVTGDEN